MKILSESRVGYKYGSIWQLLPELSIVEGGFIDLMKAVFRHDDHNKIVYHVRYLKSGLLAFIRYGIVIMLSKLGMLHIMWTCHNIEEHNFNNANLNRLLREWLAACATFIVVFHKDLKPFLPAASSDKVFVASFGDMNDFVKNQKEVNLDFRQSFKVWNDKNEGPTILAVSAAKKNNLQLAVDGVLLAGVIGVFIAPNVEPPTGAESENIFFYNRSFVRMEVQDLLSREKVIGFVGHDNISVPTSLYMFASYGIPVIGFNAKPVSSLIDDFKIGVVVSTPEDFANACAEVIADYNNYSKNCTDFLSNHSWVKAADVHRKALQEL